MGYNGNKRNQKYCHNFSKQAHVFLKATHLPEIGCISFRSFFLPD